MSFYIFRHDHYFSSFLQSVATMTSSNSHLNKILSSMEAPVYFGFQKRVCKILAENCIVVSIVYHLVHLDNYNFYLQFWFENFILLIYTIWKSIPVYIPGCKYIFLCIQNNKNCARNSKHIILSTSWILDEIFFYSYWLLFCLLSSRHSFAETYFIRVVATNTSLADSQKILTG